MSEGVLNRFYKTAAWVNCREAYKKQAKGLCELCLKNGVYRPGEIVHHKIHLTPDNVYDPSISLNFANLMLVCREHHAELHSNGKRYKVDELGRVLSNQS